MRIHGLRSSVVGLGEKMRALWLSRILDYDLQLKELGK